MEIDLDYVKWSGMPSGSKSIKTAFPSKMISLSTPNPLFSKEGRQPSQYR